MADIRAQQLPGVCPQMVLGREPRTATRWEECGLRKVVQSTRGGIWISAVRKCRCAGNTLIRNLVSLFWLVEEQFI